MKIACVITARRVSNIRTRVYTTNKKIRHFAGTHAKVARCRYNVHTCVVRGRYSRAKKYTTFVACLTRICKLNSVDNLVDNEKVYTFGGTYTSSSYYTYPRKDSVSASPPAKAAASSAFIAAVRRCILSILQRQCR